MEAQVERRRRISRDGSAHLCCRRCVCFCCLCVRFCVCLASAFPGANKGLGYHLVSQLSRSLGSDWTVLLGARDAARGQEAVKALALPNVAPLHIDLDDHNSIKAAAAEVKTKYGGVDLLVNNAGMAFKGDAFDTHVVDTTFKTNYYG